MYDQNIINKAVLYHSQKYKFSATADHNIVKFWFQTQKASNPEINQLLNDLNYKESNFKNWWNKLYKDHSHIKPIKIIFETDIDGKTLLEHGLTEIIKDSKFPRSGFVDPKLWKEIDINLTILCCYLYFLYNGVKASFDVSRIDYVREIGPYAKIAKPNKQKQKQLVWKEIPDQKMREKFTIDVSEFELIDNCIDSYTFLSTVFDKFITETYYDTDDENSIDIAGYTFPVVKDKALRNLVGISDAKKFRNITTNQKQPASFDSFWNMLKQNYSKSNRIQSILNTKLKVCIITEKVEEKVEERAEDKPVDEKVDILFLMNWFLNYGRTVACWPDFVKITNFNESMTDFKEFTNWWSKNIILPYGLDAKLNPILNNDLTPLPINLKNIGFLISTVDKTYIESFKSTFYLHPILLNIFNAVVPKIIQYICTKKLDTLPPTPILTSKDLNIFIKQAFKKKYQPIFSTNESLRFKFSQTPLPPAPEPLPLPPGEEKPEDAEEILYYSLGFVSTRQMVNIAEIKTLTEELFTLIRVNEYLELLEHARIGKNIAEFMNLITDTANISMEAANAGMAAATSRGRY